MPTTPAWSAAVNGLPGNLDATNHAAQTVQELGTHTVTCVYAGNQLLSTLSNTGNLGDGEFFWLDASLPEGNLLVNDLDQPFVMPAGATSLGRIKLALKAIGNGADIQLTLYPDSSGSPNTAAPITSVIIPKEQIVNLGAPLGLTAGGPLATAESNTSLTGQALSANWVAPASGADGASNYASVVVSGDHFIFLGGANNSFTTTSANVATVTYLGGGSMSNPAPQPSLPQAANLGMATATPSSIIFMGGQSVGVSVVYDTVWTASWDPLTGVIGSWTAQQPLPTKLCQGASASWGDTVYVIGGTPDGTAGSATAAVYYADATNGQIRTWNAASPLPAPLSFAMAAVVGNWIIVAGGKNTASAAVTTVCYAAIAPDGSLGGWQTGPALPKAVYAYAPGWDVAVTDSTFLNVGGFTTSTSSASIQSITVTPAGIASEWEWVQDAFGVSVVQAATFFDGTPGEWTLFTIQPLSTQYNYMPVHPVPMISAPLRVTGLTAGATYHLTVHQAGGDANNHVQAGEVINPVAWLYRPTHTTGPWAAHTNHALALNVYDTAPVGPLVHTWEDATPPAPPAATSTFVCDGSRRLLGISTQTAMPNDPLNANPTFGTGVSPWIATGGTLTQSAAHTQGGLPFSGLLTPTGGLAQAYATSELLPLSTPNLTPGTQGWMTPGGWFYSPAGWPAFSLVVNWYDSAHTYLSTTTTSSTVLTAGTWTQVTNTVQIPPGAAYAALEPTLNGTPATTDVVYLSNVTLTYEPGTIRPLTSTTVVDYDPAGFFPTGTSLL